MNIRYIYFFLLICSLTCTYSVFADCADHCPPPSLQDQPPTWESKMRLKMRQVFDQFLNWSFGEKYKTYALIHPLEEKKIERDIPQMRRFSENYGYYSEHPIVARVSYREEDLEVICCLLKVLYEQGGSGDYFQIAIAEVLTKVLAYYDLKIGQRVRIPIEIDGEVNFEPFDVDHIFNIWNGMPAFGLVPEREGVGSLLIFRGTDFSLDSQRGRASLLSDLDITGPGFSAFQRSQSEISQWLKTVHGQGKPARVMGFSLGGALAAYTFIYENHTLSERGSVSMCAPGVKEKVISEWQLLPEERRDGFVNYVNMGDITSKVGKLFGDVYALWGAKNYRPLTAHTLLMSSEPFFFKAKVNVKRENENRSL
ncbi:MAG: hypothetical protein WA678_06170 [Rhabdochlamydiaceae bacterium]